MTRLFRQARRQMFRELLQDARYYYQRTYNLPYRLTLERARQLYLSATAQAYAAGF